MKLHLGRPPSYHQHDLNWRDDVGWKRDDNQFLFLFSAVPRQKPATCVYSDLCRGDRSKVSYVVCSVDHIISKNSVHLQVDV